MIKVGILGGDTQEAGELIRLLSLHPDVEILYVSSPSNKGRAVSNVHRGLTGDSDLRFTDCIPFEAIDIIFIASPDVELNGVVPPELKIVAFQENDTFYPPENLENMEFVAGVSEMNRKKLVRGARAARVVPSPTSVALIVLFPLALHLMLNDSLEIKVSLPKFKELPSDGKALEKELEVLLGEVQLSFEKIRHVEFTKSNLLRTIAVEATLECGISEQEIERIYNETYNDHNFTFIVSTDPSPTEVAATQKCLIHISKPAENLLKIKAIADSFLRGGAGDAIHSMNLLFGLYEKIGLSLPAAMAFKHDEMRPDEV